MAELVRLVGRDREIGLLESVLGATQVGKKRCLVLSGEAGAGKTALLRRTQELAQELGFLTALVRSPRKGGLSPVFPVDEIFDRLNAACLGKDEDLPHLFVEVLGNLRPGKVQRRHHSINAVQVAHALDELSKVRPIAIFLDDVQWLPNDAIEGLIAALATVDSSVLLATTVRTSNGMPMPTPLIGLGSDLPVTPISVSGLDENSIGALAKQILGGPVLNSVIQELHRQTAGNPLFIQETLKTWTATGDVLNQVSGFWGFASAGNQPAVEPLVQMIGTRLKRLSDDTRSIACFLAVIGRAASPSELELVSGRPTLSPTLSSLEDEGLVEREHNGTYRLRHPLFQAALLSLMNKTEVASIHERILEVMRHEHSNVTAAELAYHAAQSLHAPADLSQLVRKAGEEAEAAGNHANAANWYRQLSHLAQNNEQLLLALGGQARAADHFDPAEAVATYSEALRFAITPADRLQLLMGRARGHRKLGDKEGVIADLSESAGLASTIDDVEVRLETAIMQAMVGEIERAESAFIEIAESNSPDNRARAMGLLSMTTCMQGDVRRATDLTRQALEMTLDVNIQRYLRTNLGWFLVLIGEWDEARRLLTTALEETTKAQDVWNQIALKASLAASSAWQGSFDEALEGSSQVLVDARLMGKKMDIVVALAIISEILLETGRAHEAIEVIQPVRLLVAETIEKHETIYALVVDAEVRRTIGDLAAATEAISQARDALAFNASWKISVDRVDAHVALAKGDPQRALELGLTWLLHPSPILFEQGRMHEAMGETYLALNDREAALDQARQALKIYSQLGASHRILRAESFIRTHEPRRRGRPASTNPSRLTTREMEVLELVAEGRTNSEIAYSLFISASTVKKHVENIKVKLGIRRRADLIRFSRTATSFSAGA